MPQHSPVHTESLDYWAFGHVARVQVGSVSSLQHGTVVPRPCHWRAFLQASPRIAEHPRVSRASSNEGRLHPGGRRKDLTCERHGSPVTARRDVLRT